MANTIADRVYRDKFRSASLGVLLRRALIAEKICQVDRSGVKVIKNPYGSEPTVTIQEIKGTYNISNYVLSDDTLTVDKEIIVAEHVFDFEETLTAFDVFANRVQAQNFAVAAAIDKIVLNELVKNAGETYTTPSGSFSTAANFPVILSTLLGMVAGYAELYRGLYLVIENTDVAGVIQNQIGSGFNFGDSALRNGMMTEHMGVEIYVTRTGTFSTFSAGPTSYDNQGKRLFGVKKSATYAEPQGIHYEEKGVSGKTGMEVVTYAYVGAKVWATNADLTIAIVGLNSPSPSPSASPSASRSPSASASASPSPSA
jgi:hypothetical protein